jgi:hypothetical protein
VLPGRTTVERDGLVYAPGARFKVARKGMHLFGMVPSGPAAWKGWSQELRPGDILTCTGYGPGFGADPGYGVEFTTPESEAAGADHCDVHPSHGGVWCYRPVPGGIEVI